METESVHPLDLLNRDEWIYTLSQLNKPRDRWNIANAHPLFRSIFETELKKEWLSPRFFASVHHLLNYLPLKNILELRLVDTGTKSAIDHCLNQGQVSVLKKLYFSPYNLVPNENDEGFHIITRPITTWMKLDITSDEIHERFGDFVPFFRQHGPQVTNCRSDHGFLRLNPRDTVHPLETLTYLRNLLTYIPNVEDLILGINFAYPEDCRWADILTSYTRDNPLPSLSALKSLCFFVAWHREPGSAFPEIVRELLKAYGAQLHHLYFSSGTAVLPVSLPCLRILNFDIETPEELESLQRSAAPIEDLSLNIVPNSPILPTQFFLALQPFQSTLRKLTLYAAHWEFGQVDQPPVDFPQVTTLALSGYFNGCTGNGLGFLDSFPNLVELKIGIKPYKRRRTTTDGGDGRRKTTGKSYMLNKTRFYRSSIWTRLQSLNSVEVSQHEFYNWPIDKKYERSTYERLYEKKLM